MKFLEKYDFNKEEIASFLNNTPKKLIDAIIKYLKNLGVTTYRTIFLEYYSMFLMDHSNFVEIFSKYVPEDLIEKLNKNIHIIENL